MLARSVRCWLVIAVVAFGCSQVEPGPAPDAGGGVTVSLRSPATRVLPLGALQLSAEVTGATNPAVVWTINGLTGDATLGAIDATGLYRAPAAVPEPATVTVRATSAEDSSARAEVQLTVVPLAVSGLLARYSTGAVRLEGPIAHGRNEACTLTSAQEYEGQCRRPVDSPLEWSESGTFSVAWRGSLLVPAAGEYWFESEGPLLGTVRVELGGAVLAEVPSGATLGASARLAAGPVPMTLAFGSSGTPNRMRLSWRGPDGVVAPVPRAHLVPEVAVVVDGGSPALTAGATHTFSASSLGSADPGVTWSLEPGSCGAELGSVTATGVYTAGNPATACEVTVVATSVSDPTAQARVRVQVSPAASVPPTVLTTGHFGTPLVRFLIDRGGAAVAVWTQGDADGNSRLRGSTLDPATGVWSVPQRLGPADLADDLGGYEFSLVGNEAGAGLCVWQQLVRLPGATVGRQHLWTRRFDFATRQWGPFVDHDDSVAGDVAIIIASAVVDPAGNAIVAWARELLSGRRRMVAARFDASTGTWGPRQHIDDESAGETSSCPSFVAWSGLAVDASGNCTVVWQDTLSAGSGGAALASNRFLVASGAWEGARVVKAAGGGLYATEQVVPLGGTSVLGLWHHRDGASSEAHHVLESAFDGTTSTWGASATVHAVPSPRTLAPGTLRAAADGKGHVVLAWIEAGASGVGDLLARVRQPTGTWGPVVELERGAVGSQAPAVAMDSSGKAVVLWAGGSAGQPLRPYAARYEASTNAWSSARVLADGLTGTSSADVGGAMDGAGAARAGWAQRTGSSEPWQLMTIMVR